MVPIGCLRLGRVLQQHQVGGRLTSRPMSPCSRALNSAITWHWKASGTFAQAAALCRPPWDGKAGGCQGLGANKAQKSSPSPELSGTQQISGEGLLFFF